MADEYVLKSSVLNTIHSGDIEIYVDSYQDLHYLRLLSKKIDRKIKAIPAADVQPVRHGRWNCYDSFALECSNCGWINYHNMGVPNSFNYCPNCGAYMKEVKTN